MARQRLRGIGSALRRRRDRLLLHPLLARQPFLRCGAQRCLLALEISLAAFAFGSYTVLLSHAFSMD